MSATTHRLRSLLALICAIAIAPGGALANQGLALTAQAQVPPPAADPSLIPADQLDSLVAPIALYPDPLLAQVLAASTYPLEIIQLLQWMSRHTDLKGDA